MKYVTLLLLVLVSLIAGCDRNDSGRVAVIDLDKIASVLGRDKVIAERVQVFATEQESKLTQLRDMLRANLEQEQEKLGEKPAREEQAKLNQLAQNSEITLRQEVGKVEEAAGQLRISLVMDFKKEVEPVARKIAAQRGMGVIMIKQNAMLYIAPASEITRDVVDALQKMNLTANPPAAMKTELAKMTQ